jgi:hypothetical protein
MQGYPTIVRTGSHDLDVQTVEQHRRAAAARGVVLFVEPLAGGGFQLSVPTSQSEGVGSTLPSNQAQSPSRSPNAPVVTLNAGDAPLLDPSGTLPSRFANFASRPSAPPQVEVILGAGEGYCEACHRVGPLREAHFSQNIGVVVLRFPRTVSGQLCKLCIDKFFYRFTTVTMLLGWWGVVSFFFSCVAIPANFFSWKGSWGMRAPTDDVESLRDKRARGSVALAIGALGAAFALLTLAVGALLASPALGSSGTEAGIVVIAVTGGIVGLASAAILFFGIRTRTRASAGLRRLGALR